MHATDRRAQTRGAAFIPVVISSIGTAAGLLMLSVSFAMDMSGGQQVASDVFQGVRWLAAGLTLLCGLLLAGSLSQFAGRRFLLQGRFAIAMAMAAAAILIALLVRTMVI